MAWFTFVTLAQDRHCCVRKYGRTGPLLSASCVTTPHAMHCKQPLGTMDIALRTPMPIISMVRGSCFCWEVPRGLQLAELPELQALKAWLLDADNNMVMQMQFLGTTGRLQGSEEECAALQVFNKQQPCQRK